MNDKEKLDIWKRKIIELKNDIESLITDKNILVDILVEKKTNKNVKLNNSLRNLDLTEEISAVKDWIRFYKEKYSTLENKIEALSKERSEQEFEKVKEEARLLELIDKKKDDNQKVKVEEKSSLLKISPIINFFPFSIILIMYVFNISK